MYRIEEIQVSDSSGQITEYIPRNARLLGVGFRPYRPLSDGTPSSGGTLICWYSYELPAETRVPVDFKHTWNWMDIDDGWRWLGGALDPNGSSRHALYRPKYPEMVLAAEPVVLCPQIREIDLGERT